MFLWVWNQCYTGSITIHLYLQYINKNSKATTPRRHILGVEIQLHTYLNLAVDGDEWSASRPDRFTPKERAPGIHWIGGWVGPRAVLYTVLKRKIPSSHRESNPDHPIVQPTVSRYTDWPIPALGLDAEAKKEIPSSPLPGTEPRSSSPHPSYYTDWATPAPMTYVKSQTMHLVMCLPAGVLPLWLATQNSQTFARLDIYQTFTFQSKLNTSQVTESRIDKNRK
jgi:hypothetical protein